MHQEWDTLVNVKGFPIWLTIIILCFLCLTDGKGKNAAGVWKVGDEDDDDEETGLLEGKTVSKKLPFEFES